MGNRNLDAKHEKILKALLRLPDNRKCAVCDTLVGQADQPTIVYCPGKSACLRSIMLKGA